MYTRVEQGIYYFAPIYMPSLLPRAKGMDDPSLQFLLFVFYSSYGNESQRE